jgi:hypothetical protein
LVGRFQVSLLFGRLVDHSVVGRSSVGRRSVVGRSSVGRGSVVGRSWVGRGSVVGRSGRVDHSVVQLLMKVG